MSSSAVQLPSFIIPWPASALLGVSARATGLRERAEALQREDAALRRRYGLER